MGISIRKFRLCVFALALGSQLQAQPAADPQTFCNPLDLSYRFMSDQIDAREAADPVIILFKDEYYLFASRSGGYWTSPDLRNWTFMIPTGLELEGYAPAVVVMRDSVFYSGTGSGQIYKTADPKAGVWEKGPAFKPYGDPDLFYDDDGKLYMCYGLSNADVMRIVELNPISFAEIGSPVVVVPNQARIHGWERRGDDNLLDEVPWIEGAWLIKHNGKYYYKYSAPGTEYKGYADGVYTADSPMGPWTYADYSPVDHKPTGYICGGGHGATFRDKEGRWWHIGTLTISVKAMFERRLGLYPVGFTADGQMYTNTEFGDFPQFMPGVKADPAADNFAGMLPLSYGKRTMASSSLTGYGSNLASDEDSRTYWCATSGKAGEWLMLDLGKACSVGAVQVNFADQNSNPSLVRGRSNPVYQQYLLEGSLDGNAWSAIIDKSATTEDASDDYTELASPAMARYVRITNGFMPGGELFAIRDLRIFGTPEAAVFTPAAGVAVQRDAADGRDAVIRWTPVADADGYIVRYGLAADRLHNQYMVFNTDSVVIHSLNHGVDYVFEVTAFDGGTDVYAPVGEFKSSQSGDWKDVNTWSRFDGAAWIYPAPYSPSPADGPITILEGHTVSVAGSDSADQAMIVPGATLRILLGGVFTVKNGIGTDLAVDGTVSNAGTFRVDDQASLSFANDGLYKHDEHGGTIPTADWRPNSTCLIDSIRSTAPANGNQDFHNVVWDCPEQSANLSMKWDGNTIGGDITVLNTGTGRWQMCAPVTGDTASVTIEGGVIQPGGQFTSNGTGNSGTAVLIDQAGDVQVTGGNFSVSRGSQAGTGTTVWKLGGNVSIEDASTQNSNAAGAVFVFAGDGEAQTLTLENVTFGGGGLPIAVDSGAVLDIGTSVLRGSAGFRLNPGATLLSGHPGGLDSSIACTGTIVFDPDAGFGFNGASPQVSGNLMPAIVRDLRLDNASGIMLNHSVTVNGTLWMGNGILSPGSAGFAYGSVSTLRYSGTAAQKSTDLEFPAAGGPRNLVLDNSKGLTLHASRAVGSLELHGKIKLEATTLTADSVLNGSSAAFINTGTGRLRLRSVGATEKFFPIGTLVFTPVWIANAGAQDTISVNAATDNAAASYGGRVKIRWTIQEDAAGGGDYTLRLGWMSSQEDPAFRANRSGNARMYDMNSVTEAGSGPYDTQFSDNPYWISRSGVGSLSGAFAVGAFKEAAAVDEMPVSAPSEFRLSQNYPNPFNPQTAIPFVLGQRGRVRLTIHNALGQEVDRLVDADMSAGPHQAVWNAKDRPSGVYFTRLEAGEFTRIRKMVLLK
jgi:xylan 1,4-beta-xylosidase